MSLRAYKFLVVSVLQQVDDGEVTGEIASEPQTVYGAKALEEWARGFEADLVTANAQIEENLNPESA